MLSLTDLVCVILFRGIQISPAHALKGRYLLLTGAQKQATNAAFYTLLEAPRGAVSCHGFNYAPLLSLSYVLKSTYSLPRVHLHV